MRTKYYHLSNTGNTPGIGTDFYQGQYMALSDDTGCSGGDHLHFKTELNGNPFDPYASPDWVSGSPIPAGYRDQNGDVHGPYALDNTKIFNKWISQEGLLGSPRGNDSYYTCVEGGNPLAIGYRQYFQKGYIRYCGTGSAISVAYNSVHLPIVRARLSENAGLNSTIIVRNDGNQAAVVTVTIYNQDGTLFDTRTYVSMPVNAVWELYVRDIIMGDPNMQYPSGIFEGSAMVTSNKDVSAVVVARVNHADPSDGTRAHAYTGILPADSLSPLRVGTTQNLPILYSAYGYKSTISVLNTSNNITGVDIDLRNQSGTIVTSMSFSNLLPKMVWIVDVNYPGFFGTAIVTSGQPVAVVVESENTVDEVNMDYNTLAAGLLDVYLPYLMKNYSGWGSCFVVQNVNPSTIMVYQSYYPSGGGIISPAPFSLSNYAARTVCQANVSGLPDGHSSAHVYSNNAIAVVVNQDNTNWGEAGNQVMSYSGIGAVSATTKVILPYMLKNYETLGQTWNTGIRVQNLGSQTANVTIQYYDREGNPVTTDTTTLSNIGSKRAKSAYLGGNANLYDNYFGSAVLTSNQPIIALGNASCLTGCTGDGDTSLTYNGINR